MATLAELPAINPPDVSDDDFLLIWDNGAGSQNTRKVTRAQLMAGVAFDSGNHDFGTSEITALTAGVTALTFASTAALQDVTRANLTVTPGNIAAGASQDVAVTMTGAATTDFLSFAFASALPAGLICQAWVSAANTVTFRFFNATGGTINGASYTARCVALTFA